MWETLHIDPLTPGSGRSTGEGIGYPLWYTWASLVAQLVKNLPSMRETWVRSLGWEDPLEEGTATHSSNLARRIPHEQRSLAGYSPWGRKELDMTEQQSTARHRSALTETLQSPQLKTERHYKVSQSQVKKNSLLKTSKTQRDKHCTA